SIPIKPEKPPIMARTSHIIRYRAGRDVTANRFPLTPKESPAESCTRSGSLLLRGKPAEMAAMSSVAERLNASLASRYRLERELGRGGFATVYLAKDLRHPRNVAIKVLHAELATALGSERFLREIEIAAGLSHPHILPLLESGAADGILYYVMPFAEGD